MSLKTSSHILSTKSSYKLIQFFSALLSNNPIRKKSLLDNYLLYRRVPIVVLISITLISSSSSFLFPSAYSQEQLSFFPLFREGGPPGPKLFGPAGIAVDPSSGNVYVAVTAVNRIQVFSSDGTFVSNWGRFGGAQNGTFSHPQGIAIDPEGNVYVADTGNNRIQVFTSNGT